jgi:hypothetical protein
MKFKEKLQAAQEMQQTSTGWYRQLSEKARQEISKAQFDQDYSPEGRIKKTAQVRRAHANQLMKAAQERKNEYLKLLSEAKADAEATLKRKVKKPSDEVITDFERSLRYLKTEILLSTRYETAEKRLNEFVSQISDPYLASKMADEFIEIVPHVLGTADEPAKAKLKLSGMFELLNNEYLPEEVRDAKETIGYIDSVLERPALFGAVVESNALDIFGNDVAKKINTPELYEVTEEEITTVGRIRL